MARSNSAERDSLGGSHPSPPWRHQQHGSESEDDHRKPQKSRDRRERSSRHKHKSRGDRYDRERSRRDRDDRGRRYVDDYEGGIKARVRDDERARERRRRRDRSRERSRSRGRTSDSDDSIGERKRYVLLAWRCRKFGGALASQPNLAAEVHSTESNLLQLT